MRSNLASWSIRIIGRAFALICALLIVGFAYEQIGELRDARTFPVPGTMIDVAGRKLHLFCKGHQAWRQYCQGKISERPERAL